MQGALHVLRALQNKTGSEQGSRMASALGRITLAGARRIQAPRSIQSLGMTSASKRGFKTNPYIEVSDVSKAVSAPTRSARKQSNDGGSMFSRQGEDDGRTLCSLYTLQQEGEVGRPLLLRSTNNLEAHTPKHTFMRQSSREESLRKYYRRSIIPSSLFPSGPHLLIVRMSSLRNVIRSIYRTACAALVLCRELA